MVLLTQAEPIIHGEVTVHDFIYFLIINSFIIKFVNKLHMQT